MGRYHRAKYPRTNKAQTKTGNQGYGSAKNSNAMDLTPGHICARGTLTEEERAKLMATGGCFRCRKQGHISRNCPDKPRQSQARGNQEDEAQIQAANTAKKPFDAKGLIEQIKELNDEDKDIVIQEVFMKNLSGFFLSSNPSAWGQAICRLQCNSVYLTRYRSMKIPVSFRTSKAMADKSILVDSGATDNFIDPRLIKRLGLGTQALERPKKIWNIDGTNNKAGLIQDYVDLEVRTGDQEKQM
jgi:hypothetical protein